MKLAVFGGSFNPPHIGHLALADAVRIGFRYDKIAFVPAFISPFKIQHEINFPQDRIEMLNLAISDNPYFYLEDYEIKKGGVSFSVDTINYLYGKFSGEDLPEDKKLEGKIGLILGGDAAADFPKWKKAEEIAAKVEIITVSRQEPVFFAGENFSADNAGSISGVSESLNFRKLLKNAGFSYKELSAAIPPVSSTQIRRAAGTGQSWRYSVPCAVYSYILENSLYGLPFDRLEEDITAVGIYAEKVLSEKRFAHSVRTAEYSQYLAELNDSTRRLGRLAYFTGLAHDITKEISDKEQLKIIGYEGGGIDEVEQTRLNLLHGRTAAFILKNRFGIKNRAVLEAIRFHTFGHPAFGDLGKILYLADKIEPGRKHASCFRKAAAAISLNKLMLKVLEWNSDFVIKKGGTVHPFSQKMYENIKNEEALQV